MTHWRVQFSFVLVSFSHFLCFSSLWAVLFLFPCFVSVSSKICLQTTLNSISASLDPHGPASSTSGESAPSTTSVCTSSSSDLGAFGRESVCSWPRLRANPGKNGGQNNQWRLRWLELADLLAENIRAQEAEPNSYLDGKLLVAPAKKRVVEITDILTWIQAFPI